MCEVNMRVATKVKLAMSTETLVLALKGIENTCIVLTVYCAVHFKLVCYIAAT